MPEPHNIPCQILLAFIDTAEQQLHAAADLAQPLAARHSVNTISKLAALMLRLAKQRPQDLAPIQPDLDRLVAHGRQVSAAVPFRCRECGDLYQRVPPVSSAELCEFCYAETKP